MDKAPSESFRQKDSLTLLELQQLLLDFENSPAWDAPKDEPGKTRHLTLHLAKLLGKIGTVVERREHGIEPELNTLKDEVIPDLLYYALSLASAHEVELQQAFLKRLDVNRVRVREWVAKREQSEKSSE